jgi:NADH dehydrogenase
VIWAAGVKPSSLNKILGPTDPQGRVYVEKDLSLKNHSEVFIAGDQTHFEQNGKPLVGQAPVAMQQGLHIADNLIRLIKNKTTKNFSYLDKGQMATIGRSRAVVNIGKFSFHGFFAWLVWLVVHIYYLIGFKNKFFVMYQWIWSYMTYKKGARLIVKKDWRQEAL